MFNSITCGDDPDVKNGKPADLFLSSWKNFNHPPLNQCLVFENAINGIHAALKAKMNVCFF
jgi:pseudouridine-5'-monophosphatase